MQIALIMTPFKAISSVRADAKREVKTWSRTSFSFVERPIVVRYDTRHSFPGLGDLFLIIMLANYLSALGNPCVFSTNLSMKHRNSMSETNESRYVRLISRFLAPSVSLRTESSLSEVSREYILLSYRVSTNQDISAVAIQIMGRLFRNQDLNPRGIAPDLARAINPRLETHPVGENITTVASIGYHVRYSRHDLNRNPSVNIAAQDCTALMHAFPESEIVWFGEREQFENVKAKFPRDLAFLKRVRYQASETFEDAIVEAHLQDFWFQRFGGGIGAPLIFGTKPYLVLSGDPIATRYYFYKNRRIVPWAGKHQKWLLLVNRERGLGDILKRYKFAR